MKKSNIIIVICIIAVCVIGWATVISQISKKDNLYSNYVKQADEWVERGLYQRAISNYNLALDEKETEEVYLKINNAYNLRYKEAPEETLDDYMDFLESAVAAYPGSSALVDSFFEMFSMEGEYEEVYNCLSNAIKNGYNTDDIRLKLRQTRYTFSLRKSEFAAIEQSVGGYYAVKRTKGCNAYNIESGYLLSKEYEYVSRANKDGLLIVTGEDSRLVDIEGMVYGIFKGKVTDAGLYSDGLIAACVDGVYSYYNDFADKQFGEYEMAGTFQNGKAAVKKNGKWMVIDTKGNVVSDSFDEIVIDYTGNYLINEMMLAKSNGVYGIYDEELKLKCELNFTDADILTKDGIIAVSKGGKWGFVKTDGQVVIDPVYEDVRSFSNGVAAVKKDGKWGFIDTDGNIVIECQFTDVKYMSDNGTCPVRTDVPEEKIDSEDGEEPEYLDNLETWKILELEIGIKENKND